jgi:enamine deaminase RidA (YjgF/YER057c/UK114 family)
MTKRDVVFPADRHALYEAHGYSPATRAGGFLFVSGQVGSRQDGTPEPDFARQVERAFDNLKATLAAAGAPLTTSSTSPPSTPIRKTSSRPSWP